MPFIGRDLDQINSKILKILCFKDSQFVATRGIDQSQLSSAQICFFHLNKNDKLVLSSSALKRRQKRN